MFRPILYRNSIETTRLLIDRNLKNEMENIFKDKEFLISLGYE